VYLTCSKKLTASLDYRTEWTKNVNEKKLKVNRWAWEVQSSPIMKWHEGSPMGKEVKLRWEGFVEQTESCLRGSRSPFHLLIHLSVHLCHHPHSHHPSLLHFFTPCSKLNFSTNSAHLNRLLLPTGLPHDNGTGPDLSRSSVYF